MDEIKAVESLRKFVDAKHHLGDRSRGWDCLNTLHQFYTEMHVDFPAKFEDWTLENYAERWKRGEGKKAFKRFLLSLGTEIRSEFAMLGDLMVFEGLQMTFPGIYLGNGHVLMAFDRGVFAVPFNLFKKFLISTRRLIER